MLTRRDFLKAAGAMAALTASAEVELVNTGAGGLGMLSRHVMTHLPDYDPKMADEPYYAYDPEKAKELIKECGTEGVNLKMLVVNNGGTVQQMIQAYLEAVGIHVEFVSMELATYLAVAADPKEYDLCCMTVSGQSNIHYWNIMYDQKQHNGATVNGFIDNELQAMLDNASIIEGHTSENLIELHKYLCEQLYYYTHCVTGYLHLWRKDSGLVSFIDEKGAYAYGSNTYSWNN